MTHQRHFLTLYFTLLIASFPGLAQSEAKPEPDVLIFANGEKLVGKLVRSNGSTVTFHSDSLGDVKADWSKIRELHSAQKFVVVAKGVELNRHSDLSKLPTGAVALADKTLTVGGQTVPVAGAAHLIDQPVVRASRPAQPRLLRGVDRLPHRRRLAGGSHAEKPIVHRRNRAAARHAGGGLAGPRDRTTLDFTVSDGSVSQPNSPRLKTEIFHGDLERDEYLSRSHAFFFVQTAFDHNFSQGLDLQQMYGGGFGWTVVKQPNETLDLKGSLSYERQSFQNVGEQPEPGGQRFQPELHAQAGSRRNLAGGCLHHAVVECRQSLFLDGQLLAKRPGVQATGLLGSGHRFISERSASGLQEELVSAHHGHKLFLEQMIVTVRLHNEPGSCGAGCQPAADWQPARRAKLACSCDQPSPETRSARGS